MPEHPIKRYCRTQGISQNELARRTGISKQYMSQLVRGTHRCGGKTALALYRASGRRIKLEELLAWGEE